MNSEKGTVFARLPFKLETGMTYKYTISYRVASQGDSSDAKSTLVKLLTAGKNDDVKSLSTAKSTRGLSIPVRWGRLEVSNEYITVKGSFNATDPEVTDEYKYLTLSYETHKNFPQKIYIDKIAIEGYDSTPMADVTGKYDFEFNNVSELAYAYSPVSTNIPSVENDGDKKVLELNSASNAYARLPFKLEPGKTYKYTISYRIASQGDSNYEKTTVLALSSGKKTEKGSPIANETTQKLTNVFSWKKLEVSQSYKTVSGKFSTTDVNVTDENCYLTLSYKTWKSFAQPLYIDKISVWEYTIPEARNKNKDPVTFEFDNTEDIDYASNDMAEIGIDPVTGKEVLHIQATPAGVAVRLPYKIKANMAYRIIINYRVDKTVDDKYYLQAASGTRESDPYFWCNAEKSAYLIKALLNWEYLSASDDYTELKSVLFVKAKDVADNNGWFTLRLKSGKKLDVNFYIDSVTLTEMTYSEAAHNLKIMDYNWSANPEITAKYVDWEKWVSTTAAVDSNGNTKNDGTKKGDTKSPDAEDSLNIGIIVGVVAAAVAVAAGVSALILFRRKRKKQ